jgi:hypothetical protein
MVTDEQKSDDRTGDPHSGPRDESELTDEALDAVSGGLRKSSGGTPPD